MAKQKRQIDYQSLSSRDLVWLVQVDADPRAIELLLERKDEVIRRLVKNCIRRYTFVDGDDMYQSLVLNFCKIVKTFRPGKKTESGKENDWDKYCYHRLTFMIKDILRQRDDLGICWPQKKMYPDWFHLYDKSEANDGCHADLVGDHRHLSEEMREQLEFYESLEGLRHAFFLSREYFSKQSIGNAAKHEDQPSVWSGDSKSGKYFWLPPQPKRKRSSLNLWQWREARSKPKQVMMTFK